MSKMMRRVNSNRTIFVSLCGAVALILLCALSLQAQTARSSNGAGTPEQRAACEVVKLIRKLRWIGMEREAKQLQMALSGFPSDKRASLVAGPHSTD